jgi:hypothetical protein
MGLNELQILVPQLAKYEIPSAVAKATVGGIRTFLVLSQWRNVPRVRANVIL